MLIVSTTSRQTSPLEAKFIVTSSGYLEQSHITVVILKVLSSRFIPWTLSIYVLRQGNSEITLLKKKQIINTK